MIDEETALLFRCHRNQSRQRKIEFHFTLEEWVAWWRTNLGPRWRSKRGRKAHQFVMARKGDVGPYSPSNVMCITQSQNKREAMLGKPSIAHWSAKARKKMRLLKLGNESRLGLKHSTETKAKMRAAWERRRALSPSGSGHTYNGEA